MKATMQHGLFAYCARQCSTEWADRARATALRSSGALQSAHTIKTSLSRSKAVIAKVALALIATAALPAAAVATCGEQNPSVLCGVPKTPYNPEGLPGVTAPADKFLTTGALALPVGLGTWNSQAQPAANGQPPDHGFGPGVSVFPVITNVSSQIVKLTDPSGVAVNFTRADDGFYYSEDKSTGDLRRVVKDSVTSFRIAHPNGDTDTYGQPLSSGDIALTRSVAVSGSGLKNEFDPSGRLIGIQSLLDDNRTGFVWKENRIVAVNDATGVKTSFEYTSNGNLTRVLHPDGKTTNFLWDPDEKFVITVMLPNGDETDFTYHENGVLRSVTAREHQTTYRYAANEVIAEYSASGQPKSFTRTMFNPQIRKPVQVLRGDGSSADSMGISVTTTKWVDQRVVEVADAWGRKQSFYYDLAANCTGSPADADAAPFPTCSVDSVTGVKTKSKLDPNNFFRTIEMAVEGRNGEFVSRRTLKWDGYRLLEDVFYDERGNTTAKTTYAYNGPNQTLPTAVTSTTISIAQYDTAVPNRLISETGPSGVTRSATYNGFGEVAEVAVGGIKSTILRNRNLDGTYSSTGTAGGLTSTFQTDALGYNSSGTLRPTSPQNALLMGGGNMLALQQMGDAARASVNPELFNASNGLDMAGQSPAQLSSGPLSYSWQSRFTPGSTSNKAARESALVAEGGGIARKANSSSGWSTTSNRIEGSSEYGYAN